jgi:acyl-homoserine-lactone acylase
VRPITSQDLVKLTRRLLAEGGVGQFAEALAGRNRQRWQPAGVGGFAWRWPGSSVRHGARQQCGGSGRAAFGQWPRPVAGQPALPVDGRHALLPDATDHPGQLDVMGAALPGLPVVNIGFNQHLAWTHTVDTSKHFTLYRLQLDPKDPTRYLLDGKSLPLARQTISVAVKARMAA